MRSAIIAGWVAQAAHATVVETAAATCDAGEGTCVVQETTAASMMQLKVKRAEEKNKLEQHVSHTAHATALLENAELLRLGKKVDLRSKKKTEHGIKTFQKHKGHVNFLIGSTDYKKYKQHRLKEAIAKKKQGLLSKRAADVLEAALTVAEAFESSNTTGVDPNEPAALEESLEHDSYASVVEDGEDDAMAAHHAAVMHALEEFAESTSPEDAAAAGVLITGEVMDEIFGLPDTPMNAPTGNGTGTAGEAVQGDMVSDTEEGKESLLQAAKMGVRWYGQLWESKKNIRFCFGGGIAESSKTAFLDAVQHFRNMIPCIDFKEVSVGSDADKKCAEEPGIYVYSSESGCFANVGQPWLYSDGTYGSSVCHLQPNGCDTVGVAAHEIGHNLGMMHEQARTDSTDYVKIFWDNIQPAMVSQYELEEEVDKSIPYDIMSLMHYGDTFFAKIGADGKKMKTMEALDPDVSVMGNEMGLTHLDAIQVSTMYGCKDEIEDFTLCTNDPEKCTTEDCICHQDPSNPGEVIKTTDAAGCNRCQSRCPDYPTGNTGICGCVQGTEKGCFTSGGTEYCYCKEIPPPTPAPTPAPPHEMQEGASEACKPDLAWWCYQFTFDDCGPSVTVGGEPILEACATMCGLCETPAPCWDVCTGTCAAYAQYCDNPLVTIDSIPFPEACPVTCGTC